jgi:hypothetical protein
MGVSGAKVDWRVEATVDREFMVEEMDQLPEIRRRRRISCIVSAMKEASRRLGDHRRILKRFVGNLHPRMLR